MPRPRKQRSIQAPSEARYYKPRGVPMRGLKSVPLAADGLEALRLADVEGLEHTAAAEVMGVSRPTFSRLLSEARTTTATALVNGWALDIAGHEPEGDMVGQNLGSGCQGQGLGKGLGQGQGFGQGRGPGCAQGQMRRRRGHQNKWQESAMTNVMHVEDTEMENTNVYAVTAKGTDLDADVDPRFGRAAGFVLVNAKGELVTYISNADSDGMAHGAGLAAAEVISKAGATILLTGHVGPKAAAALQAAGIQAIEHCEGQTVKQAVEAQTQTAVESA